MSTVLITGGSGLIGNALTEALLQRGFQVIILSRNPEKMSSGSERLQYAKWNIKDQEIDESVLNKADYIIHLAGASVIEKRWTEKRKKEIVDSRVEGSRLLINALQKNKHNIKAVIGASAIGWYGADPAGIHVDPFTEEADHDDSFLGNTCKLWEDSIEPVTDLGIRLVRLRIGIVFSNEGGAFKKFRDPLRAGIAPIIGSGKQIVSWIHIDDLVRMFLFSIDNIGLKGSFNAVAPHPVSNRDLVMKMAKCIKGKFFVPVYVPSFVLKLMLGEASIEVLKSTTVSCKKIQEAGFIFQYPELETTLNNLLNSKIHPAK